AEQALDVRASGAGPVVGAVDADYDPFAHAHTGYLAGAGMISILAAPGKIDATPLDRATGHSECGGCVACDRIVFILWTIASDRSRTRAFPDTSRRPPKPRRRWPTISAGRSVG